VSTRPCQCQRGLPVSTRPASVNTACHASVDAACQCRRGLPVSTRSASVNAACQCHGDLPVSTRHIVLCLFVFACAVCLFLRGLCWHARLYLRCLTVSTQPVFVCVACRCTISSSLSMRIVFVCTPCRYPRSLSVSTRLAGGNATFLLSLLAFVCAVYEACLVAASCLELPLSTRPVFAYSTFRCRRGISTSTRFVATYSIVVYATFILCETHLYLLDVYVA
jgi:hypothetical protein